MLYNHPKHPLAERIPHHIWNRLFSHFTAGQFQQLLHFIDQNGAKYIRDCSVHYAKEGNPAHGLFAQEKLLILVCLASFRPTLTDEKLINLAYQELMATPDVLFHGALLLGRTELLKTAYQHLRELKMKPTPINFSQLGSGEIIEAVAPMLAPQLSIKLFLRAFELRAINTMQRLVPTVELYLTGSQIPPALICQYFYPALMAAEEGNLPAMSAALEGAHRCGLNVHDVLGFNGFEIFRMAYKKKDNPCVARLWDQARVHDLSLSVVGAHLAPTIFYDLLAAGRRTEFIQFLSRIKQHVGLREVFYADNNKIAYLISLLALAADQGEPQLIRILLDDIAKSWEAVGVAMAHSAHEWQLEEEYQRGEEKAKHPRRVVDSSSEATDANSSTVEEDIKTADNWDVGRTHRKQSHESSTKVIPIAPQSAPYFDLAFYLYKRPINDPPEVTLETQELLAHAIEEAIAQNRGKAVCTLVEHAVKYRVETNLRLSWAVLRAAIQQQAQEPKLRKIIYPLLCSPDIQAKVLKRNEDERSGSRYRNVTESVMALRDEYKKSLEGRADLLFHAHSLPNQVPIFNYFIKSLQVVEPKSSSDPFASPALQPAKNLPSVVVMPVEQQDFAHVNIISTAALEGRKQAAIPTPSKQIKTQPLSTVDSSYSPSLSRRTSVALREQEELRLRSRDIQQSFSRDDNSELGNRHSVPTHDEERPNPSSVIIQNDQAVSPQSLPRSSSDVFPEQQRRPHRSDIQQVNPPPKPVNRYLDPEELRRLLAKTSEVTQSNEPQVPILVGSNRRMSVDTDLDMNATINRTRDEASYDGIQASPSGSHSSQNFNLNALLSPKVKAFADVDTPGSSRRSSISGLDLREDEEISHVGVLAKEAELPTTRESIISDSIVEGSQSSQSHRRKVVVDLDVPYSSPSGFFVQRKKVLAQQAGLPPAIEELKQAFNEGTPVKALLFNAVKIASAPVGFSISFFSKDADSCKQLLDKLSRLNPESIDQLNNELELNLPPESERSPALIKKALETNLFEGKVPRFLRT